VKLHPAFPLHEPVRGLLQVRVSLPLLATHTPVVDRRVIPVSNQLRALNQLRPQPVIPYVLLLVIVLAHDRLDDFDMRGVPADQLVREEAGT